MTQTNSEDWHWQEGRTVLECNGYMFENEVCTDITFIIGGADQSPDSEIRNNTDTKKRKSSDHSQNNNCREKRENSLKIRAHKYVLMSRSPYFFGMFNGPLAEKSNIIHIEDCKQAKAFTEMLRYVYTESVQLTEDTAIDVLYLARKCILPGLIAETERYIYHSLTEDSVLNILESAMTNCEQELMQRCLNVIELNTQAVFDCGDFKEIGQTTLKLILDEDTLSVPEIDVFNACWEWATHSCRKHGNEITIENIREVLGDCLYKIRFQSLPMKDFTTKVVQTNLLSDSVACQFYQRLTLGNPVDGENVPKLPDGFQPQKFSVCKELVLCDSDDSWTPHELVDGFDKCQCHKINFGLDFCFKELDILPSRPIILKWIVVQMEFEPDVNDSLARKCFIKSSAGTVRINGVGCCNRLRYEDDQYLDTYTHFNEYDRSRTRQYVILYLDPVIIKDRCIMELQLDMCVRARPIIADAYHVEFGDDRVSISVKWGSCNDAFPFCGLSYVLAD